MPRAIPTAFLLFGSAALTALLGLAQQPKKDGPILEPIDLKVPHVSTDGTVKLDYDIVYVRAPRKGDGVGTNWTEISNPTFMDAGADLMLLHPDGKEEVLVAGGAALPTGLVESELFGHEKGAFTGAIARRVGRFELAHGGSIFLDEIGDLPPDAQAKLLRVLQEREFDRVGGSGPIQADVRVIAATNRDLLKAVRDKTFREDLYYRLNVFPIALPPLRERKQDIPLLVRFLLDKFKIRVGKPVDGVSQKTMQRLTAYPWPGNVRELENVLERAVILAAGPTLEIDPGSLTSFSSPDSATTESTSLEAVERHHILAVLDQTDWVIDGPRGAARLLDLHPNTLRSRLKRLGIKRAPHDPS